MIENYHGIGEIEVVHATKVESTLSTRHDPLIFAVPMEKIIMHGHDCAH